MTNNGRDRLKRAAEFIQANKYDAMENSQFVRLMSEVPRDKCWVWRHSEDWEQRELW